MARFLAHPWCHRNSVVRWILKSDANMAVLRWITLITLLSIVGTLYLAIVSDHESVKFEIKNGNLPYKYNTPTDQQMPLSDEEDIDDVFRQMSFDDEEESTTLHASTSTSTTPKPLVVQEVKDNAEQPAGISVTDQNDASNDTEKDPGDNNVPSDANDSGVDLEWLAERERLLASNGPRKLFLFAYMHGGSTLLFKLFDQDPRTFAWYETLGPLYGHMYGLPGYRLHTWIIKNTSKEHDHHYYPRVITSYEIMHIKQLFMDMFSCNMEAIPREVHTSSFMVYSNAFKKYWQCYSSLLKPKGVVWERQCVDSTLNPFCGYSSPTVNQAHPHVIDAQKAGCPDYLEKARVSLANPMQANITKILEESNFKRKMNVFLEHELCLQDLYETAKKCMEKVSLKSQCQTSTIRTTKILRLKMPFMEPFIRGIPDMQIVYYIRDPRAVAASRLGPKGPNNPGKFVLAVIEMCEEIQSDVRALDQLEKRYPNIFLRLRYEDLVEKPDESVTNLFKHISMDPTPVAYQWIHNSLHGDSDSGVQRKNATFVVNKWRMRYSQVDIEIASNDVKCKDVLQKFGYS